jgi:hypothetical protein
MNLNPVVALSEQFQKLINEHGSAAILRDNLAFFKTQIEALEKQIKKLEEENTKLIKQLAKDNKNNPTGASLDEFVEHRGSLFKRKPEGGYHLSAYCPKCRCAMGSGHEGFPFQCLDCSFIANFKGAQLAAVIGELP